MDLGTILYALVNGLSTGLGVFLIATGITLIFGILKILNFAHGSFFMVGAYVVHTFVGRSDVGLGEYALYCLVAGVAVGALGYLTDLVVLRRLRGLDEATSLIATFALLLIVDGAVKAIWGLEAHSVFPPEPLGGVILLGPAFMPTYSLALIGVGIVAFVLLDLAIRRMWFGKVVQALSVDRFMAGLLGINVPFMFTATVIFAFFLAGLAGGLLLPNQSLSPGLSHSYLLDAFIVVIIGGLGNVRGAFVAALVLGLVESLNIVFLPSIPGVLIYVAMILFLMWKPHGLFASGDYTPPEGGAALAALPPSHRYAIPVGARVAIGVAGFLFVLSFPAWANGGLVFLAGITMIEALFALSWNLLFGFTGLASFGHAAFFAIGAYAMGYLLKNAVALPFLLVLPMAALAGGLAAMLLGAVAIRRTAGIALAVLTLAVSEVLLVLIGASVALGREDGLAGIPRPVLDFGLFEIDLRATNTYYFFICFMFMIVSLALWWLTKSEFGRIIRAIRQDKGRVEFLGIKAERYRLASFTISGALAAFAGALHAPWVQIASPESAFMMHSAMPMLSALLGGVEYFWGPVVGTVIFSILSLSTRTLVGISDLVSGVALLAIVLMAPAGVLGTLPRLFGRLRGGSRQVRPAALAAEESK